MGTVYLARLSGAGGFRRTVAIKRLHPHLAKERSFIEMFLDEARLASRIHHPNVVPIVEIGENESGYYVVMEYVEGSSAARVFDVTREKRASVPVTIRIVLDALLGLHAAHELPADDGSPLGLVHRDVSPHNILVGTDGASRITDFGVARAASRLTNTQSGQVKGKLAYMAPEQAAGAPLDRRADLFAMGIVLWEGLTGKRLFKRETDVETLTRLLYEPIVAPSTLNPDVPPEVDAVVLKALERDPHKRYPTGADFAEALEGAARIKGLVGSPRAVAADIEIAAAEMIADHRDLVCNRRTSQVSLSDVVLPVPEGSTPTYSRTGSNETTSASNIIHVGSQRLTQRPNPKGSAWRKGVLIAVPLLGVTLAATALGVSRRAEKPSEVSAAVVAPQVLRAAPPPPPAMDVNPSPVVSSAPAVTAAPQAHAIPRNAPKRTAVATTPSASARAATLAPAPTPVPATPSPKSGDDFANPYR